MGTINYKTGQVITMGLNVNYDEDPDMFSEYSQKIFEQSKEIIDKYHFNWFDLTPEYGYYEGTSVIVDKEYSTVNDIKMHNPPSFFQMDAEDINEALTELEELKKALLEISSLMPVCYPGWCMGYEKTKEGTEKAINDAIEKIRTELNDERKNAA